MHQRYYKETNNLSVGFSTIEILITFAIGIIFLTAAMMVAFSDPTLARQISLDSGQAAALDATLDNTALSTSTNRLGNILASLTKNWNATILSQTDTLYTTTPTITDVAPCFKTIDTTTTWNTLGRSGRHITFGTGISNLPIAKALGRGGCDPNPPSDWKNPGSLASFDPSKITTANSGVEATSVEVKSIDGHTYVFLTSQHASKDVPDFWIIDVTDTDTPTYVASLDINNGTQWGGGQKEGANDVVVVGNYAYVLRNHNVDQLQVINISDPEAPTLVTPAISFESRGVNKTGSDPQGEVIKYYNGKLYIGLHNTQGPEFLVYNIASNPAIPTFVGAIANSFNHSIYDIALNGSYAYLAIKPGTGGGAQNTKELMVINITGTTPVDTTAGFNANNTGNDTEGATALHLIGSRLYLGRERVSNASEKDFYIFDVTSPGTPTLIGTGANLNQPANSAISGLYVSNRMAFVGMVKTPEFRILNVSNTANIVDISNCSPFNFSASISDIAYQNDLIFASVRSNDFLRIIHNNESTSCTK